MRIICHVTTAHRADDVRIFERECRSLARLPGARVVLIGPGHVPPGSRVDHIELPAPPSGRFRRFASAPLRGWRATRPIAADVYHFHDPELIPVALALAKRGERVVWDAHEDYEEQVRTGGGKEWIPEPGRRIATGAVHQLLKSIDRSAAAVVTATPTIAGRYSNVRTVVVGNGARLEDFRGCTPDFDSRRVLFTGYPGAAHCFDEVVEAVAAVPGVSLAVAGRLPQPTEWARATATLGDRIRHLGWLDRSGLAREISRSAVGMVTYADTPAYGQAEPTKLFEFTGAGLPVVCTPNESILKLPGVGLSGVVAADFTHLALAEALGQILSDRPGWESKSSAARDFAVQEGSWAEPEARLLGLYSDLLHINREPSFP